MDVFALQCTSGRKILIKLLARAGVLTTVFRHDVNLVVLVNANFGVRMQLYTEPGLADRMQVESALGASESDAIESELLIAAKDASDMIATQDALLEAVLKASAEEAQGSWQPAPWQSAPSAGQSAAHSEAQPAVRQQPALWQQQQQASSLQEWADRQADTPGSRGTASVGDEHEHAHAAPPVVVGGSGEGLSEVVQQLIAMGFPLGRAVQVSTNA